MHSAAIPHYCPPDKRKFVLIAAVVASAMGYIDGSVVAVALPQMRAAVDASFVEAQWISNAYLLFLSSLILLGGALGDRFGIRTVFAWGIGLFTLASLGCALAWNVESLLIARAVQGVGAAAMIPGSMALISVNTPRAERGRAMGIWVGASSITTAMGPFAGGLLLTYGGPEAWRWIFALNLPVGLAVLALVWRQVPADAAKHQGGIKGLDWTGAVLLTLAMGLLAAGLTQIAERGHAAMTASLLIAGGVVAVLAVMWELRCREPMLDLQLFSSRGFSGANILTFLTWSSIGALVFFLPMLIIVAWKLPPSYAGGMFLPFSAMIAVLSPLAGRMVDRFGVRGVLTAGSVVVGIANLVVMVAVIDQNYWTGILPAMLLVGIGIGLSGSPVSTAVMNAVPEGNSGAASGINNVVARGSNLFAIAGLGAVVTFVYDLILRGSELDPLILGLMMEVGYGERLTGALYQIATVDAQVVAMTHAMATLCVVLALMAFVSAAVGWATLSDVDNGSAGSENTLN